MPKPKRQYKKTRKTVERARAVVRGCMIMAHEQVSPQIVNLLADHVLATLPPSLARRFAAGDLGTPHMAALEIMKPYVQRWQTD